MSIFRALTHRNYRLFFSGQLLSLLGTWINNTATAWLAYRLTDSALMLGLVSFCLQVPAFLFSPFGGIFADRFNRRKIMIITQTLSMAQSFALAALTLSGKMCIEYLFALSIAQGFVSAFDMSARQSLVIEMLEDKNDLSNAIALNSSMFNAARLVGPALGGILIAKFGEGWCFFIDGISYIFVIVALLLMKIISPLKVQTQKNIFVEIKEGWHYAFNFQPIRTILILVALTCFLGTPYTVLLPVFAREVFGGNSNTLGFLMSSAALGALSGALWLAWRQSILGLVRIIVWGTILLGVGTIFFSFSSFLPISFIFLVSAGFGLMILIAASNTILQTIAEPDKRGRVISLFLMAYLGAAPLSSLLAGALSEKISAPATLQICGALCLYTAFWFNRQRPQIRQAVRPIYVEKGILPELASGIQTATHLKALDHQE